MEQTEDWTCSMHPFIHLPHAGKCPVCGMDLILSQNEKNTATLTHAYQLSEASRNLSKLHSTAAKFGKINSEINLLGTLELIPGREKRMSALTAGRVLKVWVSSVGSFVRQGDVLFEIEPQGETSNSTNPSTEKVRAPITGAVLGIYFKTGEMLEEGRELYSLVDLSTIRVSLDVYESGIGSIYSGLPLTLFFPSLGNEKLETSISSVDVTVNPETRLGKVKAELNNSQFKYRPGMNVTGLIKLPNESPRLLIPKEALLNSGKRILVYVEQFVSNENRYSYEPREILLGVQGKQEVEVLSGVKEGDLIVDQGAFAIDAAMQLQGKTSLMTEDKP